MSCHSFALAINVSLISISMSFNTGNDDVTLGENTKDRRQKEEKGGGV